MAFQVNYGAITSVTISGSIAVSSSNDVPPWKQTGSTIKTGYGVQTITNVADFTLYTVTAGKTFYLTSIQICAQNNDKYIMKDNATEIQRLFAEGGGNNGQGQFTFPTPIPFTNTVKIRGVDSASSVCHYGLVGWEA